MPVPIPSTRGYGAQKKFLVNDWPILLLSIVIQLVLGLLFGHIYDMRIFMATGYLVGTGQNPYIPQDLSSVFHNLSFQGITTVGYPPPWPLVLGVVYRIVYSSVPNILIYNLGIKIPIIAANIGLAYLVSDLTGKLGAEARAARKAWIFMLLNPFLLYMSAAWGQFDSIVALSSLLALVLLGSDRPKSSAILLALALALKPTVLPLVPVAFLFLIRKSVRQTISYYGVFFFSAIVFCVAPFLIFGWDPSPIIQNWNAHLIVGGGLSFMTFLELLKDSTRLPESWWPVGLVWIPALAVATWALRDGIIGLKDLLKKSAGLIMVFFLTRAWVSEPNIILVVPLVLLLTSIGDLDRLALTAVWTLPLIFSILNTSAAQLFFPSMPNIMNEFLALMDDYRAARLIGKLIIVVPWQLVGWWIVLHCFRRVSTPRGNLMLI